MAASRSSGDQEVPEFFSVFLSNCCSHQLPLSSAFNPHLDSNLLQRRKAIIIRPAVNKEWIVDLVEENNEFYFKQGWEKVVEDNDLKHGEFMLFRYLGGSVFTVSMYGVHACLKESVIEGEKLADVELVDDYEEGGDDDVVGKRSRAGRPSTEDPKSEAIQAAKFYMKTHSDYPSFRVSIGPGYYQHRLLNIPLHFVDAYMKITEKRNIFLQVMDKFWSVTMKVYRESSSPNCKLMKGVHLFMDANNIQEGDVLVFELVKLDTFRVSIFPC